MTKRMGFFFLQWGVGERGRAQYKEYRIFVPQPETKPVPPAVEAQSPNLWTAREVPRIEFLWQAEDGRRKNVFERSDS